MESHAPSSPQRSLFGLGLVLSGLLAGVLLMQLTQRKRTERPSELRTVEFHKNAPAPAVEESGLTGVFLLNEQFKQVSSHVKRAVVSIHAASSWYNLPCAIIRRRSSEYRDRENLGSGVLVSPQGYIVTNNHLVDDACGLRVTFVGKEEYDAEVVGADPSTDLAVIRVLLEPGHGFTPLPLGDSDAVRTGEWVLAVGNPLSLTSTVTAGIVSALGRRVDIIEDQFRIEDFIQTDAAINPGNSGGALVNLQGELIGINTAIATQTGFNEGYGFAIPVSLVDRVVRDLIAYGEVQRGFVGVSFERVDAGFAQELGLQQVRGVYLNYVRRDGAAHRAGLREGDVVLSVQNREVNEPNEIQSIIARYRPGDSLALRVWRRGVMRDHVVTLLGRDHPSIASWIARLSRPEAAEDPHGGMLYPVERWGLFLRSLTAEDVRVFGAASGAMIAYVSGGSIAGAAGVPGNVVLQEINGNPVTSADQAYRLLVEADEVRLSVLHADGRSVTVHMAQEQP